MDKIISQTLEHETAQAPIQESLIGLHVDVWNVDANARMVGPNSVGYDDEIGLWEELEHRYRLDQAFPR
jgi:hypothetical protein